MLGDTATVSSSVNPGGDGAATNTHHHHHQQHQHQSHHNPSPAGIGGGGLFQEGINTPEAGGVGSGGAGHVGSSSGGEEDRLGGGSGSFGGNRWPRQETLALLKIRADMDATFRDASVKGPLWDEVSRKMAELGYHRSAKKCKEKFENVYKYHKRTKDGRMGKQEGKNYRFFEQLAAFESQPPAGTTPPPHPQPSQPAATITPVVNLPQTQPAAFVTIAPHVTTGTATVPSTTVAASIPPPAAIAFTAPSYPPAPQPMIQPLYPPSFSTFSADLMSNSSSSTSSDVELHRGGGGRQKRKRKWKDLFERLMTEVVHKQEEMQRKFLEAIEKRERERMAREDSWRVQEIARINREREILAQERSIAAAKDAAVMAFLQKVSEQQNPGAPPLQLPNQAVQIAPTPPPPLRQPPVSAPPSPPVRAAAPPQPAPLSTPNPVHSAPPSALAATSTPVQPRQIQHPVSQSQNQMEMARVDNVDQNFLPASSSRWPKVEVEALIALRKKLDSKYQENGPKGPLWEEISAGMKKMGYNRNAKRCKEKWENINKYFKKVKESNKKRPEDSKTCPYFHQLDALYREKQMLEGGGSSSIAGGSTGQLNSVPLMVQPEQQWPPTLPPPHLPPPPQQQQKDMVMEEGDSEDHDDEEEEYDDEDDDDDMAGEYELVSNKPNSKNNAG